MKKPYHILLSGGGTGGHIYPAIAIANELKARHANASILFVGAKDKMEMEKVPQAGYKIKGLWISGLQRQLTLKNLSFPFKLIASLFKAWVIVKQFKPDVVIGTGGFASGPTLYMASLANIPTLVQEQNSYPGITNKLLAKKAHKICVAYSNLERFFKADKLIKTGNPVRQDLVSIDAKQIDAKAFFNIDEHTKTLLILGGSLGARAINKLVEANLELFKADGVTVIWQCGKLYYDTYKTYNNLPNVQVHQFINNMALAYAAADIIVSRAGASSVSELCLVGKPVIFIPSPNVAEDHQTKNAKAVSDAGAAILLKEKQSAQFSDVFSRLLKDQTQQQQLSNNIKKLALPNATKAIVDEIEKLIKN